MCVRVVRSAVRTLVTTDLSFKTCFYCGREKESGREREREREKLGEEMLREKSRPQKAREWRKSTLTLLSSQQQSLGIASRE